MSSAADGGVQSCTLVASRSLGAAVAAGLTYSSQSESPRHRAISKAQKIRTRLGGGSSLFDPFPGKPPRMHRLTYYRLFAKGMAAEERSIGLERDYMRRH